MGVKSSGTSSYSGSVVSSSLSFIFKSIIISTETLKRRIILSFIVSVIVGLCPKLTMEDPIPVFVSSLAVNGDAQMSLRIVQQVNNVYFINPPSSFSSFYLTFALSLSVFLCFVFIVCKTQFEEELID